MKTPINRRDFLSLGASSAIVLAGVSSPLMNVARAAAGKQRIEAIAFDAFPIFDPRPIFGLVKSIFPDQENFGKDWFAKIFAYTWLRTNGNQYTDFQTIIAQALDYTIAQSQQTITDTQRQSLLDVWLSLKPWPDVIPALETLEQQGIKCAFLSNFTEDMLRINARNSGIEDKFTYLSTDRVKAYKPAPSAYSMAIEHFNLSKDKIAFCAFAPWDAAGASWFGYPTIWVNRLNAPPENLDAKTIISGNDLSKLLSFVKS